MNKAVLLLGTLFLLCHLIAPSASFFFPKSLFRRLSPASPPSDSRAYQQPQNPASFHVPKSLCIACEKFPWTPVSGPPLQQQASQQASKTIVINALGPAKEVGVGVSEAGNRKPFAIQFQPQQNNQNQLPVNQGKPSQPPKPENDERNANPATRPITFQIYEAPKSPTVLQPARNPPPPNNNYQNSEPYMQPPPPPPPQGFQSQQGQYHQVRPFMVQMPFPQPQASYGRPTILQPQQQPQQQQQRPFMSPSYGMLPPPPLPPSPGKDGNGNNANSAAPVPPITISTIVAAQQGRHPPQYNYRFQGIMPAKLVYQEHSEIHPPKVAPYQNLQQQKQQQQQQQQQQQPQIQYGKPFHFRPQFPARPPPGGFLPPAGPQVQMQVNQGQVHQQQILNLRPPLPPPQGGGGGQQPQEPTAVSSQPQSDTYYSSGSEREPVAVQQQQASPESNPASPSGVVKNPQIQSIQTQAQEKPSDPGWEIIPAVHTDITHLFQAQAQPAPTERVKVQPVPVPVPIPIPEAHAGRNPLFVVRNQGAGNVNPPSSEPSSSSPQGVKPHANIVVHGITYHEEQRKGPNNNANIEPEVPQGQASSASSSTPQVPEGVKVEQQQQQPNQVQSVQQPQPSFPHHQPQPQTQPQPQVIFKPLPVPGRQFEPLPASISTALYHAQRTSYLTHQYLQSNPRGPVFLHTRPQFVQLNEFNGNSLSGSGVVTTQEQEQEAQGQEQQVAYEVEGQQTQVEGQDQTMVNCQNHAHYVPSPGQPPKPVMNFMLYPTPVQQSSVFWVQQPTGQPQQSQQYNQEQDHQERQQVPSPAPNSDKPVTVYEWSSGTQGRQADLQDINSQQSQSQPVPTEPEDNSSQQSHSTDTEKGASLESLEYEISSVPYGERLPGPSTVTPYDIISVGNKDDSSVQSLEEESSSSSQTDTFNQGKQEVSYGQEAEVGEDKTGRPSSYVRPVSTTIIHSPDASSYMTQSQAFPFRPQRVIVHDFTKGGFSTSSEVDQGQGQSEPESSQASWTPISEYARPKSPKFVDEGDEDRQSLASISETKVVQYHHPVVTGQVTTAECATASTHAISVSDKENAEVPLRLGARFPAGRPSLNAFSSRISTTSSSLSVSEEESSSGESVDSEQASISVPVYVPSAEKWSPPKNTILDDIYKHSEMREAQSSLETGSLSPIQTQQSFEETTTAAPSSPSTEKSSTFSISMENKSSSVELSPAPTARKVPAGSDGQKLEIRFSPQIITERPVFVVTSSPVLKEEDPTFTTPFPAGGMSTSTKIIKTVRVRQRMRTSFSGGRGRFNGTSRVRVVHRPALPDYLKNFPELVTPESEKLGKLEEEEVKNALIELKRTERARA